MLCDYFILRKTELDVDALYDSKGEYGGVSAAAIFALILSVLPNLPGFLNAVTGTAGTEEALFGSIFDQIYGYAWFIGLPLAMIFYWIFKTVVSNKSPSIKLNLSKDLAHSKN